MARILVMDDIEYVRKNIALALANLGHEVFQASNGKEGIEILSEKQVDLLVTDIVMPQKSGIEILMDMKERLHDTKIIVITGNISPESEAFTKLADSFGVAKILYKPFKRKVLIDIVNELLGKKA